MATIGLKRPVYAIYSEDSTAGTKTYSNGAVLAKAISLSITPNNNEVNLFADDTVAETDKTFVSCDVSLNIDELSEEAKVAILGYVKVAETNEYQARGDAQIPYIGLGMYSRVVRNGTPSWRAIWLTKGMFAEPTSTTNTKGDTTEFQTPTLDGTFVVDIDGVWKEEAIFTTETEAVEYLDGKAGI